MRLLDREDSRLGLYIALQVAPKRLLRGNDQLTNELANFLIDKALGKMTVRRPEFPTREKPMHRATAVERAYELAREGCCRSVGEIEKSLRTEGYDNPLGVLYGASIRSDLRQVMAEARTQRAAGE